METLTGPDGPLPLSDFGPLLVHQPERGDNSEFYLGTYRFVLDWYGGYEFIAEGFPVPLEPTPEPATRAPVAGGLALTLLTHVHARFRVTGRSGSSKTAERLRLNQSTAS